MYGDWGETWGGHDTFAEVKGIEVQEQRNRGVRSTRLEKSEVKGTTGVLAGGKGLGCGCV